MRSYQKLAVFIAVLLFSVSLISAAIDILGDISAVELDTELQNKKTASEPAGSAEAGQGEGELENVESASADAASPLNATPGRMEDTHQAPGKIPTVTNITGNDPEGVKGRHFKVYGTVTTSNGSSVEGLPVEVFLKVSKNETGTLCGRGEVRAGLFNVTCEASVDLEVGPYNLVAHTLGNAVHEESWSDPRIRIVAETKVTIEAPSRARVGDKIKLGGRLIDRSNGQPIGNMTIVMRVGNETVNMTTDSVGTVTAFYTFDAEGNKTVTLSLEDADYYRGSSDTVSIAVTAPPNILELLMTFPYNMILVGVCAASAAAVVLLVRRRGRQQPPSAVEAETVVAEAVEEDLSFNSYKEGIVKLFNRFYASTQLRYGEVRDCLTPREFQQVLMGKIPEKGACALDDLVTTFEIANYSGAHPTEEDYDRCQAAVEMLNGLMEHG